jgi:hypothetical protein
MPIRRRIPASSLMVEAIERRIVTLRGHRVMLDQLFEAFESERQKLRDNRLS